MPASGVGWRDIGDAVMVGIFIGALIAATSPIWSAMFFERPWTVDELLSVASRCLGR